MVKQVFSAVWNYIKRLDKILLLLCVTAGSLGVFYIYALSSSSRYSAYLNNGELKTQVVAMAAGIFGALIIAGINYRFISKLWFLYGPAALILSLLLFTPMGIQRAGTDDIGWLNFFGIITFQPSEVLKLAFILTMATHLNKIGDKLNKLPHLILVCIHGLAPVALVSIQGDDGSAMVFLFIFIFMVLVAGISWKYILAAAVLAPVGLWFVWNFIMQNHHRMRFLVVFDQSVDVDGIYTYQINTGLTALGSGQLMGKGLFGAEYTYVPEIWNDYIFSFIGMSTGFLGCMTVVILLGLICMRLISNISGATDTLGKMIVTGVFAMIIFHSIINIGMVLGVTPVVGIPLLFFSAGGTSILTTFISIGLVLSVYAHPLKKKHMFYTE